MLEHRQGLGLTVMSARVTRDASITGAVPGGTKEAARRRFLVHRSSIYRHAQEGMIVKADALQTRGFFAAAKQGNWKALNSFTHSGAMQIGRRFTENDLSPSYSDASVQHQDDAKAVSLILERIAAHS